MYRRFVGCFVLVCALAFGLGSGILAQNPLGVPDLEYEALLAVYSSTDGPNWNNSENWLTQGTGWYGVNIENGHVVRIDLSSNNLSGSLPPEIGNLSCLSMLNLRNNRLVGSIPAEIGSMSALGWIDLSSNALGGEIPASITALGGVGWIGLDFNTLTCSNPDVDSFLAPRASDWRSSQTVPPTNVTAYRLGSGSIMIRWDCIQFGWGGGHYEIGISNTPGGPYTFDPSNYVDIYDDNVWLEGIDLAQPVYIVIRTVTPAGWQNQNTLISINCIEAAPILFPYASKMMADGANVSFSNFVVTAVFPAFCYVENEERTAGMRIVSPYGGYPEVGTKVDGFGIIRTGGNGERYLEIIEGREAGTGEIAPLGMTCRNLGGGSFGHDPSTGAGQRGVDSGAGLNNIGLLVRAIGACTYIDAHTFSLDDGSGVSVICNTPPALVVSPSWDYVAVNGVSSMRLRDGVHGRLLMVTKVDPINSRPPEGVTGRWEMTSTSGMFAGVFGMLLAQNGTSVGGSMWGYPIVNGQMNDQTLTYTCTVTEGEVVDANLTLSGDTLTGTWTIAGMGTAPVTFQRVSPDPFSPYQGRPKVVSATCDGQRIDITWDRPINGWDYQILDEDGQTMEWYDQTGLLYDPVSYVYTIVLNPTMPFVPGATYTVRLDWSEEDDYVDWHDPYGVPAWEDAWDAYEFQFVYPIPD